MIDLVTVLETAKNHYATVFLSLKSGNFPSSMMTREKFNEALGGLQRQASRKHLRVHLSSGEVGISRRRWGHTWARFCFTGEGIFVFCA